MPIAEAAGGPALTLRQFPSAPVDQHPPPWARVRHHALPWPIVYATGYEPGGEQRLRRRLGLRRWSQHVSIKSRLTPTQTFARHLSEYCMSPPWQLSPMLVSQDR